jgi:quercetin dioxygenase-like cupin family protein
MELAKWKDMETTKVEQISYNGKSQKISGIAIRWLSAAGKDKNGNPEYGLRWFTAEPNAQIPIHNHFYAQTMYILSGHFECWSFDVDTGEITEKVPCGPGDSIYVPSMEPHGMKNISDSESGTFLCCIGNIYDHNSV